MGHPSRTLSRGYEMKSASDCYRPDVSGQGEGYVDAA
jgi:hypothetical protein